MKSHKSQEKTVKKNNAVPVKSLNACLDNEVELIHQDLDELKTFLAQHSALVLKNPLDTDARHVDDYYNSTDDLFRQVALETGSRVPFDALCYDTYLLRKKKKCREKR